VKVIQSDNGSEFTVLKTVCEQFGIRQQFSTVENQAENGMAERKIHTLLERIRALMYGCTLPMEYWPYALQHAVYIENRTPKTWLSHKTPIEALFGNLPDLSLARIFGSPGMMIIPNDSAHKQAGTKGRAGILPWSLL
jgi:transposase InsO family protein